MANLNSNTFSHEVRSDLQAVLHHLVSGRPLDEQLLHRVTERSRKAQEDLVRKFGVREIAVDLIREGREEE